MGIVGAVESASTTTELVTNNSGHPGNAWPSAAAFRRHGHAMGEPQEVQRLQQVKLLAVVSEKRSPFFPDVPTVAESGAALGLGPRAE